MVQAADAIDIELFLPVLLVANCGVILSHDMEEIQNYIFSRLLS